MTKRFKLLIEYDGTPYAGWQKQNSFPTVQGHIEDAFLDFLGAPTRLFGSGRTDAGVHAKGQVAHVDITKNYDTWEIQGAVNKRLKFEAIRLLKVEEVPSDFHARFSATSRAYEYKILNRSAAPTFEKDRVWWVKPHLSESAMHEAAQCLVGHHDFTSFRDTNCQAFSPVKTLDMLTVERQGEGLVIKAKARSFLHHQIRNFVGTLKRVGDGSWEPQRVKEILAAKDRRAAGPTAPSCGLYLTEIEYS